MRIGNAAHAQLQLDVYGELMDALYVVRRRGLQASPPVWRLQCTLLGALEKIWSEPDEGIWEVRGPRRHFTHSRVMAWVAFDRAVKTIERYGCEGPADRWREIRDTIHAEVCRKGFDAKRNTFVQYYGSTALDASLLMIPLVGFLPASDPRVVGTIEAIERELTVDGLVQRYTSDPAVEGSFLACTFWLADAFALLGRRDRASAYFHRLLELRNDVGLLAEEYDAVARRQVGNFPQALSHIALVNTAMNLRDGGGPAPERATG